MLICQVLYLKVAENLQLALTAGPNYRVKKADDINYKVTKGAGHGGHCPQW